MPDLRHPDGHTPHGVIALCPAFFAPTVPDLVNEDHPETVDRTMALIHEMIKIKAIQGAREITPAGSADDLLGLRASSALGNAASYAFFAQGTSFSSLSPFDPCFQLQARSFFFSQIFHMVVFIVTYTPFSSGQVPQGTLDFVSGDLVVALGGRLTLLCWDVVLSSGRVVGWWIPNIARNLHFKDMRFCLACGEGITAGEGGGGGKSHWDGLLG